MFSKIRKHLNIVVVLIFVYIIFAIALLVGNSSIFSKMVEDRLQSASVNAKNVKANISNVINDASMNIVLFEKTAVESPTSTSNMIMQSVFDEIEKKISIYKLQNILLYTTEYEYYNLKDNQGIKNSYAPEDLSWVGEIDEYYQSKITYFYDENLGQKYIVVSQKVKTNDMVIGMCYETDAISKEVFYDQKGSNYIADQKGKIVLTNHKKIVGENLYEKNNVIKKNKNRINGMKGKTEEVEVEKIKYYISVEPIEGDLLYVSLKESETFLEKEKAWKLRSIAFVIIITLTVGIGFFIAYIYSDKINNLSESKVKLVENISNAIKQDMLAMVDNVNLIKQGTSEQVINHRANSILNGYRTIEFKLNSILGYSKMSMKKFENNKDEYTMIEVVNSVESILGNDLKQKNLYMDINIESDERLKFYGDRMQVEGSIVSLLKMSIENTMQGGLDVHITNDEMFGDRTNIVITVKDSSEGIDDKEAEKIQNEISSKINKIDFADIGMGKNMINKVIKNLRGKIEIKSSKNSGVEYILRVQQVALYNTDEDFIREQRNLRNKKEEEELNMSFWGDIPNDNSKSDDVNLMKDSDNLLGENDLENTNIQKIELDNINYSSIQENDEYDNSLNIMDVNEEYDNSPNIMDVNEEYDNSLNIMDVNDTYENTQMSVEENELTEMYNKNDLNNTDMNMNMNMNITMEEMNKKYMDMMNNGEKDLDYSMEEENVNEQQFYNTDVINSMGIRTLYVDEEKNELSEEHSKKIDKMNIYLQEGSINVEDGISCSGGVNEYEKALKEFYNYSHKNVKHIIGLWNQKNFEQYYIESTRMTTSALNIGAMKLYNMLCEQQNNYNSGDMKLVAKNVKAIFAEWKAVLLYIADYYKN